MFEVLAKLIQVAIALKVAVAFLIQVLDVANGEVLALDEASADSRRSTPCEASQTCRAILRQTARRVLRQC